MALWRSNIVLYARTTCIQPYSMTSKVVSVNSLASRTKADFCISRSQHRSLTQKRQSKVYDAVAMMRSSDRTWSCSSNAAGLFSSAASHIADSSPTAGVKQVVGESTDPESGPTEGPALVFADSKSSKTANLSNLRVHSFRSAHGSQARKGKRIKLTL